MITPKNVMVDGMEFSLNLLPALKASKLDKKIIGLLIPVLGGIKEIDFSNLDKFDFDFGKAFTTVGEAISNMPEQEYEKFVIDMFSTVVYIAPGEADVEINGEIINTIFRGKLMAIYKLLWEVMKYNHFSFFEVAGGGIGMMKTFFSKKDSDLAIKPGSELEMSES